jgi:hypothetical protein
LHNITITLPQQLLLQGQLLSAEALPTGMSRGEILTSLGPLPPALRH